ncbi:hypothetical protein TNCV_906781 [Trichonephila clavipes]|nr:hypothetical protein TNCV_906781 [Trichonephila clavipes]
MISCPLEKLRYEIETASHATPVATLRDSTNNEWHPAQKCLESLGQPCNYFNWLPTYRGLLKLSPSSF